MRCNVLTPSKLWNCWLIHGSCLSRCLTVTVHLSDSRTVWLSDCLSFCPSVGRCLSVILFVCSPVALCLPFACVATLRQVNASWLSLHAHHEHPGIGAAIVARAATNTIATNASISTSMMMIMMPMMMMKLFVAAAAAIASCWQRCWCRVSKWRMMDQPSASTSTYHAQPPTQPPTHS